MRSRLDELKELYAYDDWARERILAAVSKLTDEQRTREVGGSFPSVQETLAHLLKSDWVWLERWKGDPPDGWPADRPLRGLADLRAGWDRVATERHAWIEGLSESDLERVVAYRNLKGEPQQARVYEMLRHVVNHATYHRGQVTSMIRMVGGTPVSLDLIAWYRERAAAVAAPGAPS